MFWLLLAGFLSLEYKSCIFNALEINPGFNLESISTYSKYIIPLPFLNGCCSTCWTLEISGVSGENPKVWIKRQQKHEKKCVWNWDVPWGVWVPGQHGTIFQIHETWVDSHRKTDFLDILICLVESPPQKIVNTEDGEEKWDHRCDHLLVFQSSISGCECFFATKQLLFGFGVLELQFAFCFGGKPGIDKGTGCLCWCAAEACWSAWYGIRKRYQRKGMDLQIQGGFSCFEHWGI